MTMAEATPPPASRRFSPTPIETTAKKVRRFSPELVETTSRSCRRENLPSMDNVSADSKDVAHRRRFVPELVEASSWSNKHAVNLSPPLEPKPSEPKSAQVPQIPAPGEMPAPRRRFVPELIETTKRTKRAGDTRPATLPTDKTDLTPGVPNIYTHPKRRLRAHVVPAPSDHTPLSSSIDAKNASNIPPRLPRREPSMRPHPNTRRSTRQNSFTPELEPIVSENSQEEEEEEEEYEYYSDEDDTPSLSGSLGSSEDSRMRLQLARTRESCDDRFSGYLLALAAKAAEKQLREQALAGFPNESTHHIVEHFYDREIEGASDEESIEGIGLLVVDDPKLQNLRRQPTEVGWAAKEMREHQEKLDRLREEETHKKVAAEAAQPTFKDPFWTNGITAKNAAMARGGNQLDAQKEAELERMRSAASPPMLGSDLKFRMCLSPKATKFESDQRIDIQPNRCEEGGGLWGGYCIADEPAQYLSPSVKGPPMIQTPQIEREDPFSSAFAHEIPNSGALSPRSKARQKEGGVRMLSGIDERLQAEIAKAKEEEALLEEFDDTFVTQVYNYLSLGYPALARQYDEELARISRIKEDELRANDSTKHAQGYIALRDPNGFPGAPTETEKCARWKALRVYILEWGRQHPSMSNGAASPSAWGVRARRGSWAI